MLTNVQESAESRFCAVFGSGRSGRVVETLPEAPDPELAPEIVAFRNFNRQLHFEKRTGTWRDSGMHMLWLTAGRDSATLTFESNVRSWQERPDETLRFLAQALCGYDRPAGDEYEEVCVAHEDERLCFALDGSYVRIVSKEMELFRFTSEDFRTSPVETCEALYETLRIGGMGMLWQECLAELERS